MTTKRSRQPLNCQRCGRFVPWEAAGIAYDDYTGGWDADPYCPTGRGCAKDSRGVTPPE